MDKDQIRVKVVDEARSWLGTPWHHEARIKGAGVDCGMLILEVFEKVGLIPHIIPPHYGPDFMLHRTDEWYVELILNFADEISAPPYFPADAIVMKNGRIFSHGGIIVDWPLIIHASSPERAVLYGDVEMRPLCLKQKRIFRHRELI